MENNENKNKEINDFLNECNTAFAHIDLLETIEKFTNTFEKAIKQNIDNSIRIKQLQNLLNQFDMLLNQFIEEEN